MQDHNKIKKYHIDNKIKNAGSDSDSPDDSTVKCGNNGSNYSANYHHSSSSASSSSSEDESVNQRSKSKGYF